MLDIPSLNFFLPHSIVWLNFKINGKWEENNEKKVAITYAGLKIPKRINLDFKKMLARKALKNIRAQKVQWKPNILKQIKTPWIVKNIYLPKNTYERFLSHFSFLISHFLVNKKTFPTNICWSKKNCYV
jgi:hypothetical protein